MPPPPCDCTIVPFEPNPPCFERCAAKILCLADSGELTNIFGLPETLSDRIVAVSRGRRINSLRDYARILDREDLVTIYEVFENLDQEQLDSFQKAQKQRSFPKDDFGMSATSG